MLISVDLGSFKGYRAAFLDATPPLVPYMGVHLQDLTFIEQGNPDRIDDLINWEKRVLVSGVLDKLQRYQTVPFKRAVQARRRGPTPEVVSHFINSHAARSEQELYEDSLVAEPRGVDARSLRMV